MVSFLSAGLSRFLLSDFVERFECPFLARFRILTKILAIVVVTAAVAAGISFLGMHALASLNDSADNMKFAAQRALDAARANQNVIALNRAEFRVALDPTAENRAEVHKVIDEQMKLYEAGINEVSTTRDDQARSMLPAVNEAMADYKRNMENTLRIADEVKDAQLAADAAKLRDSAMKSRASAEKLRATVKGVADRLNERVANLSATATVEYETASRLMIIIAVVGVLFGMSAGFMIGQYGVAKPIRSIVELLRKLANGEFAVEVQGTDREDEIGDIAKAAVVFKDNGLAKVRMEQEQKENEKRVAEQRKADIIKMADSFEGAVGEIIEAVSSASTELEASAESLTKTAERAQHVTTTVAAASEEASTNVQSVASATEKLSSSVNEISRQVQESARMANEAVDQARKTNDRVGELSKAAARIGDVVELINTIAGQTNLLALNATIEAARAGEAGRGFAVVASVVKALAEQTAKATGEIGQQITGIQAATQDSVTAIKEISGTIEKLSEISSTIAAAVEEQGAATQEISRNVQQAALGTEQVSSNITDVQRGAGETGSASSQVLSAAQSLSRDSNRLKLEVGKFLNTVRAA
jgi:methyl-accepting chemotaxis protein